MKKNLHYCFITMLSLILALPVQKLYAQKADLGIHVGANMDYTVGDALNNGFNGTFLAGVFGGIRFKKAGVSAELNFSQNTITTGDNFSDAFGQYIKDGTQQGKKGTFKLNELQIPVLFNYNIYSRLWIQAGPQFSAVVSIKDKDDLLKSTKDVFKSGDVSGVVGLWLDLPFHLRASGRYVFGLSNRNNTDVDQNWRTGQIQIAVGYNFL